MDSQINKINRKKKAVTASSMIIFHNGKMKINPEEYKPSVIKLARLATEGSIETNFNLTFSKLKFVLSPKQNKTKIFKISRQLNYSSKMHLSS